MLQIPGDVGVGGDTDAIERQIMEFCTPKGDQAAPTPDKRIDVIIANKEIEIAERNVDDIALKFVPTLTVQLSANATGLAFAGPFSTGWSASGVLTIPLYDGGVRYGEMRDRKALVEEAKLAEERGRKSRAGQIVRMLDIPAERAHGVFDDPCPDGGPTQAHE